MTKQFHSSAQNVTLIACTTWPSFHVIPDNLIDHYRSYSSRQIAAPLRWRHNEYDGVSNNQLYDCLPNHLFRRRSKKTSKLRVTGLCEGNSPVTGEFPHKGPVTRKMFSFEDVIMLELCLFRNLSAGREGRSNVLVCNVRSRKVLHSTWPHGGTPRKYSHGAATPLVLRIPWVIVNIQTCWYSPCAVMTWFNITQYAIQYCSDWGRT